MKKCLLILLLVSVAVSFISCSSSNELNSTKKITSVIIMPIAKNNGVYFREDYVWHRLVWSFESNGFNVINNDSVWNILVDTGYDLSRLTDSQVMEIAKNLKTDLIILKGIYGVVKVFDSGKKEFVVYDDMGGSASYDVRSAKGKFVNNNENKYAQLVMKVRGLGY
jgi:hypothetical protein